MNTVFTVGAVVLKEAYRRKDVYVLFFLTVLLTLLAGTVTFFEDLSMVRLVKEIALLLIWIATLVIAVTMTARQIPMERESRTIFPLLAKPIARSELLLGKFWGCWLATGLTLLVFYAFFGVVCASREAEWAWGQYAQALVLHWAMLAVVIAMTLFGSLVFAAPSSTNTIVLVVVTGILLMGRHLGKVAMALPEPQQSILYGLYFVIPHLEFFDVRDLIVHAWPMLAWPVVGLALLYAAAYTAVFLSLAVWTFRRKSLT